MPRCCRVVPETISGLINNISLPIVIVILMLSMLQLSELEPIGFMKCSRYETDSFVFTNEKENELLIECQ